MKIKTSARIKGFTPAQLLIMQYLAEDKTSDEISTMLGCSREAVDAHIMRARMVANTKTRAGLLAHAFRVGVVD